MDIQELLSKGTKGIAEQRLSEIIRRGVYSTNTYIPTISALRDLEASGNLALISDPTIRRELSQLSYQIDSVDRSFAEYLFFHQHDLDPFIARNLPIVTFLSSASGAPVLEKGEADWSSLDSDLARGLLAFKMSLTHNYTQSLEKLDLLFTNLIAQIETAIQPL
ncbi:hypothetical protein R0135_10140 [Congregibacter variabilis]|uniref:Uncharacterized protein n=1 Tax=Congregibacter variabilis TaxID=3081200 RepID=A0ABZ0HZC4_9GAMM|nr:hypothetical protein R0135_10140 [Congregibacter sp. IMCC43200]